jgi:hypothetical protein
MVYFSKTPMTCSLSPEYKEREGKELTNLLLLDVYLLRINLARTIAACRRRMVLSWSGLYFSLKYLEVMWVW